MPRFLANQPDARLIPLPWNTPLADWPADQLVALPRGISRHVVRFIRVGDSVYAAKELLGSTAVHEYRLLQDLQKLNTPAVEPIGVVSERRTPEGEPLDTILLTRHLQFSLPYRTLFSAGVRSDTVSRLLDAMVVLLARLHLVGFLWGDVSLSNILFRRDAGEFAAYLVDAETGELHASLTDGQRAHDLDIAMTNLFGEFCDLEAGQLLDQALDPEDLVAQIEVRYLALWHELTASEEFPGAELHRIESRVRRLNNLGFDVAELDIQTSPDGSQVQIQPKVVDAGHHSRRLLRLTGIDAEENQARRLLNDLDAYRTLTGQQHLDEAVVAHQWLSQAFQPVVSSIPPELTDKRDPAQVFHEVLEHRWYASQRENREVPLTVAAQSYMRDVLSSLPDEAMSALPDVETTAEMLLGASMFDPNLPEGLDDDAPVDPWEASAHDPEVELLSDVLDIDALRRKAAAKEQQRGR